MTNGKLDKIIFGGSFDPPHGAHFECINFALQAFPGVEILMLPDFDPPGLPDDFKSPSLPYAARVQLCQLGVQESFGSNPRVGVKVWPEGVVPPKYAVDTVRYFKQLEPQKHFALMIGADQFLKFFSWRMPVEILTLVSLVVVERPGNELDQTAVEGIVSALELESARDNNSMSTLLLPSLGTRIHLIKVPTLPAASRQIRSMLANNEVVPKHWLPTAVEREINLKGYYKGRKDERH